MQHTQQPLQDGTVSGLHRFPLPGTSAFFDQVAGSYRSWYLDPSPGGYAMRVRWQRLLELLDEGGGGGKLLDVGCGPAVTAGDLLERDFEFWGVDAAPRMIEEGHRHHRHDDRVHLAVADARNLPFPDESFDAVISLGVIDRLPGYENAIREMVRVVKKGRTLLIAFPNLLGPYAAWKAFVFYPVVTALRPVYYRLINRPRPPALPFSVARLHTPRGASRLLARYGAAVTDSAYYNFNVALSPLDDWLPDWSVRCAQQLEQLRSGWLRWLGAGFILKARRLG